jgi:sulfide:quinone oxidoreductase
MSEDLLSRRRRRHVVVLGGGFGGLTVARALRKYLRDRDKITVVDHDGSHVQGLSLLWILRGWRDSDNVVVTPTRHALKGIDLQRADVLAIDVAGKSAQTSSGILRYDALVVALGAELNYEAVPGLKEALDQGLAHDFYTTRGAEHANKSLSSIRSGVVAVLVTTTPYKCPGAPWEAAFLAHDLLAEVGKRDDVDLHVYTPEPQPMPVAGPVLGAAVVELLAQRNIGYHANTSIDRVDVAPHQLVFKSGETADFDYLLVVPPHRAPEPVRQANFSDLGWIPVDAATLRTSVDGVWAIGDSASIMLTNGKPLPKAAVFARGQAEVAAAGVANYLGQVAPDEKYTGIGHCFLEVGGHMAAKGAGNFYAPGGPDVQLHPPSVETHWEKEAEEKSWLDLWNTPSG